MAALESVCFVYCLYNIVNFVILCTEYAESILYAILMAGVGVILSNLSFKYDFRHVRITVLSMAVPDMECNAIIVHGDTYNDDL